MLINPALSQVLNGIVRKPLTKPDPIGVEELQRKNPHNLRKLLREIEKRSNEV